MSDSAKFSFRRAKQEDIKSVREMIQELADFEKMSNGPELSEADLIRDSGLNGGPEFCHIFVLDYTTKDHVKGESNTQIIGYAACFLSYSTWQGKSYFLEDIYVRPDYRKLGAGARIFREVAAQALAHKCKRMDFHVLSWNPARAFYKRMGALNLTETEDWNYYRVPEAQVAKLAAELE